MVSDLWSGRDPKEITKQVQAWAPRGFSRICRRIVDYSIEGRKRPFVCYFYNGVNISCAYEATPGSPAKLSGLLAGRASLCRTYHDSFWARCETAINYKQRKALSCFWVRREIFARAGADHISPLWFRRFLNLIPRIAGSRISRVTMTNHGQRRCD